MVNSIIKMEACMMETGRKTRWKVSANSITNQVNLLMKVNGEMINSWAKVYSIMKFLNFSIIILTTIISMMSISFGQNIKVNSF